MTWISIPGPKHTFLVVAVQPEPSNFNKKKSVLRSINGPLSWHMSVTGLTLADMQWSVSGKILGPIAGNSKLMVRCICFCICFFLHVCKGQWQ